VNPTLVDYIQTDKGSSIHVYIHVKLMLMKPTCPTMYSVAAHLIQLLPHLVRSVNSTSYTTAPNANKAPTTRAKARARCGNWNSY